MDSFLTDVTTTPTMNVRAAKALFDAIIHKFYCRLGFELQGRVHVSEKSVIKLTTRYFKAKFFINLNDLYLRLS